MITEFMKNLIFNASLLLTVSIIANLFFVNYWGRKPLHRLLAGMIAGIIGIFLILATAKLTSGIVFDTRSILISTVGMFFGTIPTALATLIISAYRLYLGGAGALTGVLVTVFSAGIGLSWHHLRLKKILQSGHRAWLEFYALGLLVHIVMLFTMLTLPGGMGKAVISDIWVPVLMLYPIATVLLCMLLFSGMRNVHLRDVLADSELRFRTIFEHSPVGIVIATSEKVLFFNNEFKRILGRTTEEILALPWQDYTYPDDIWEEELQFADLIAGKIEKYARDKRYLRPDGSAYWVHLIVANLQTGDHMDGYRVCLAQDIDDRKRQEEEVRYLSYHDALTGLYNRAYFDRERKRLDTSDYLPLSLIVGDIDGLKLVNDAFGHAEGDRLLIRIADLLKQACVNGEQIFRTGGDEFCILLPGRDEAFARDLCETIRAACDRCGNCSEVNVCKTSISLGYATKKEASEHLNSLMNQAEDQMYRRKLLVHQSLHSAMLTSIKAAVYEVNNETEEHARRMTVLARDLGKKLGLSDQDLVSLELVAALHDIGKIGIDQSLFNKEEPLTEEEWREVKKHPDIGYRIAQTIPELREIAEHILCHHENWDGSGYPQGLAGLEIPLIARAIAIIDAYDAMTEDRSFRTPLSPDIALQEIRRCAGTQFDPDIAKVFLNDHSII